VVTAWLCIDTVAYCHRSSNRHSAIYSMSLPACQGWICNNLQSEQLNYARAGLYQRLRLVKQPPLLCVALFEIIPEPLRHAY